MACLRAPASKAVRPDGLLVLGLGGIHADHQAVPQKNKLDFRWTVFIRVDVYEFIVRDMADYGKHAAQTLEWDDDELLKRLLRKRIEFLVCRRYAAVGSPVADHLAKHG